MKNHSRIAKKIHSVSWILFPVFLILKLTGVITWSWWWVTAPLWIPLVFAIAVIIVCTFITIFEKN